MKISKIIATGLGTGYAKTAPGTAGALLGTLILFFLNKSLSMFGLSQKEIFLFDLFAILFVSIAGTKAIEKVHKIWPHDDNRIVIDEIAGVWIALLLVPTEWKYYLTGFLLFRFFDIVKPLGIKKFDKMKNNWSVMLDDILAGFYAFIGMQILLYFNLI